MGSQEHTANPEQNLEEAKVQQQSEREQEHGDAKQARTRTNWADEPIDDDCFALDAQQERRRVGTRGVRERFEQRDQQQDEDNWDRRREPDRSRDQRGRRKGGGQGPSQKGTKGASKGGSKGSKREPARSKADRGGSWRS